MCPSGSGCRLTPLCGPSPPSSLQGCAALAEHTLGRQCSYRRRWWAWGDCRAPPRRPADCITLRVLPICMGWGRWQVGQWSVVLLCWWSNREGGTSAGELASSSLAALGHPQGTAQVPRALGTRWPSEGISPGRNPEPGFSHVPPLTCGSLLPCSFFSLVMS